MKKIIISLVILISTFFVVNNTSAGGLYEGFGIITEKKCDNDINKKSCYEISFFDKDYIYNNNFIVNKNNLDKKLIEKISKVIGKKCYIGVISGEDSKITRLNELKDLGETLSIEGYVDYREKYGKKGYYFITNIYSYYIDLTIIDSKKIESEMKFLVGKKINLTGRFAEEFEEFRITNIKDIKILSNDIYYLKYLNPELSNFVIKQKTVDKINKILNNFFKKINKKYSNKEKLEIFNKIQEKIGKKIFDENVLTEKQVHILTYISDVINNKIVDLELIIN